MSIKFGNFLNAVITSLVAILFLATVWNLNCQLSSHDHGHFRRRLDANYQESVVYSIFIDLILIGLFVLQHSGQPQLFRKNQMFSPSLDLDVLQRTFYTAGTSVVLQILIIFWKPIDAFTFWNINTSIRSSWWWIFFLVHFFSWSAIYGGFIVMDLAEMIGMKQVYYHSKRLPQPILRENRQTQRLYRHMRHGGIIPLALILWIHPVMRLDRAILSVILTLYMLVYFKADSIDHSHLKTKFTFSQTEPHKKPATT